jgi:O-antigen/teichoic acid export membrane protein
MNNNRRVIRNLLLVFSSEGIGGILSFVILLLSARLLGVENFGVFSFILAITSVCQLVADFGLTNLIVREVAKDKERAPDIMGNVLTLAWCLSLLILVVVTLISWFSLDRQEDITAAVIMGVAVLATYHGVVYSSVCRAFEHMGYNAFSFVAHKVILLALILFFSGTYSPFDSLLVGIAIAYLLANLCQYAFFVVVVNHRFFRFTFGRDFRFCLQLLKDAIPIGASMVIRRLTLQVDVLILSLLASVSAVGIFNAAYKVVQVVDMIPFAICLPLFPAMSRLATGDKIHLEVFFSRALTGFLIVSIPLSGYLFISATNLIDVFYGYSFSRAGAVLQVLSFSIIGLFVNMLLSYLFIALDKQNFYLLAAAACLITNGVLDAALIPFWGELGAAYGTLAGEFCYFVLCVYFLRQVGVKYAWLANTWRPVIITFIAGGLCHLIVIEGVLAQVIVTGVFGCLYVMGLFVFRVLSIEEVVSFVKKQGAAKDSSDKGPSPNKVSTGNGL